MPIINEKKGNDMTTQDASPLLALQQLTLGYQVSQCIYVVTRLGIADLLKDGPRTSEELAQATGAYAPSLYRILRLLAAIDVFTEGASHTFTLAPLGVYLQTGVPDSQHHTVLGRIGEVNWQAWGGLFHSVKTGESAFQSVFGASRFEYNAHHPEEAALFDAMMTEMITSIAPTVTAAYDFSAISTIVDIGGGHGQMLASILQAYPTLRGVLFDLPHVAKEAPSLLKAAGVADRCEVRSGDAFAAVPAHYDTYLFSRVIHDWDDESAIALLSRCHEAMDPQGKVLLVERVILRGEKPQLLVLEADVQMMSIMQRGRERTDIEYRALLSAAGFELIRLVPVQEPFYIIEAIRV